MLLQGLAIEVQIYKKIDVEGAVHYSISFNNEGFLTQQYDRYSADIIGLFYITSCNNLYGLLYFKKKVIFGLLFRKCNCLGQVNFG